MGHLFYMPELPLRLLTVLFLVATLFVVAPALAQPRDEAPDATPAGPVASSVAEELTAAPAEEKPVEPKPAPKKEKKPVKKAEPKKEKKAAPPKPEKKPAPVKEEPKQEPAHAKEPEAKKAAPVAAGGKEPVIVINPCTGDVSEELVAPQTTTRGIQPGRDMKCLSERQCDALCRVGESFGDGGGSPHLSPRGDIVFGSDAFTGFDDCVKACGPKCK